MDVSAAWYDSTRHATRACPLQLGVVADAGARAMELSQQTGPFFSFAQVDRFLGHCQGFHGQLSIVRIRIRRLVCGSILLYPMVALLGE
jgi:hypothetical protein